MRAALVAVLVACACAPSEDYSATAGYVCEVMGEAFCGRFDACFPNEWPECNDLWIEVCCGEAATCNVRATRTTAWAEDCAEALTAQECGWFHSPGQTFPEECRL